jgi:L-cysteine/cystine lyase
MLEFGHFEDKGKSLIRMNSISTTVVSLEQFRQQFPALHNKAYFNYGGQGPMPKAALEAIYQAHEFIQVEGPFSNGINNWINEETTLTRQAIAQALHVPPETMTLTEDVTVGCNIALWGLEWRSGDHILLSDCEHPGVIAAIQELQRRFGVEVSMCPLKDTLNEGDPVATIANHLHLNTRLVVISHILWNTGQVLPLGDIVDTCRNASPQSRPIRILVDAAQSVGVLPLNLTEIGADFYAFTGHKWWCGPAGLGGLYVHPDAFAELNPTFIGWRGVLKDAAGFPIGWQPDSSRFEIATSDYALYSGLRTAIALHHQWGTPEERYQRIQQLSEYLWQQLNHLAAVVCLRTLPPQAGLVSFQLPGKSHRKLVQFLESKGFMLRTLLDPDCVRACVHYFTSESEIDQLVTLIQTYLAET